FNNFLVDTYALDADARGWLEFPRELPGLLVVLMAAILCMLTVTQMGIVGALTFAAGLLGLALWGPANYWLMVFLMMVGSAGMHLLQPVTSSIALSLGDPSKRGWRMGQLGVVGVVGSVLGAGIVWLLFLRDTPRYGLWFAVAAGTAAISAVLYFRLHIPHLHQPRARLVIRKRFWLYYLLEFLFGARKQIFLTFGFWVLIKEYGQHAGGFAGLIMIASIVGLGFKPLVGLAIDRFGERSIMIADGLMLAVVCIGYGFAKRLTGDAHTAHRIASACFIADNLLFALGTSRSVYVARLTESPQELTSTLAVGVSINHIASMVLPGLGGLLWMAFGYERVFVVAALLAVSISAVSTLVPKHGAAATA
ncbi:MAG: MFS transporter, partial [Candidatus Hydrogenedentes bacterium]|nr:MFS transporter [Candidatus Hydrogenedentota bacterium]